MSLFCIEFFILQLLAKTWGKEQKCKLLELMGDYLNSSDEPRRHFKLHTWVFGASESNS